MDFLQTDLQELFLKYLVLGKVAEIADKEIDIFLLICCC